MHRVQNDVRAHDHFPATAPFRLTSQIRSRFEQVYVLQETGDDVPGDLRITLFGYILLELAEFAVRTGRPLGFQCPNRGSRSLSSRRPAAML